MTFLRIIFLPIITLGLVAALLGGYAGALHPLGDSLAVFRLYAMFGLLVIAIYCGFTRRKIVMWVLLLALSYSGFDLRQHIFANPMVEGYTLLQSNIRFSNNANELFEHSNQNPPDFVMLQEVTTRSIPQLAKMRSVYPYQVICPFAGVGGVAILSKFKILGPQGQGCIEGQGMVSARIVLPEGEITLVSLHLYWPFPFKQRQQLAQLIPIIEAISGPIIVAGDFNMVPWGESVVMIERASRTRVIGGIRPSKSLVGGVVQLPIDHVLLPVGWQGGAVLGPKLGSDHRSVLASFTPTFE